LPQELHLVATNNLCEDLNSSTRFVPHKDVFFLMRILLRLEIRQFRIALRNHISPATELLRGELPAGRPSEKVAVSGHIQDTGILAWSMSQARPSPDTDCHF